MSGDEVFQDIQAFTEIGLDRQLDRMAGGIRHQSTHAGKLLDLLIGTTGSGIRHHKDVIVFIQAGQKVMCQLVVRGLPGLDHLFIALLLCDQAPAEVLGDMVHRVLGVGDQLFLGGRHRHIRDRYGHGRSGGELIADGLDVVQGDSGLDRAVDIDDLL